jgi:hypothetical protein
LYHEVAANPPDYLPRALREPMKICIVTVGARIVHERAVA